MTELPDTDAGCCAAKARWVYALSLANACCLIGAFTLPWLVPNKSGGFDAAAEGALLFLGSMALALVIGLIGLVLGVCWRKELTFKLIALLIALLPVTLFALALFFAYAIIRDGA